jgi:hypothetical protein
LTKILKKMGTKPPWRAGGSTHSVYGGDNNGRFEKGKPRQRNNHSELATYLMALQIRTLKMMSLRVMIVAMRLLKVRSLTLMPLKMREA